MASEDVTMCCVGQHATPDLAAWYEEFKKIDATGFHKDLGITKSWVSKLIEPNADGKPQIQVVHFFPKSKLEGIKKVMDFNAPPFVGGPDLIKNGIVLLPVKMYFVNLTSEITYQGVVDSNEPLSVMAGGHGIPEHDGWYKEFCIQEPLMVKLGCISSAVGMNTEKNDSGKDQCFVAHLFRSSHVEEMKKTMKFDGPPFVGGEDYIKKGIIVPPIEFNISTLMGQAWEATKTKTVLLESK